MSEHYVKFMSESEGETEGKAGRENLSEKVTVDKIDIELVCNTWVKSKRKWLYVAAYKDWMENIKWILK